MKNVVSGYSKSVVLHCRGCIFQGFQFLEKVGKTTSEIDSKWHQNAWKSVSEGSPKRSLKLQWKIQKIWWKKVSKMRSKKGIFLMILGTFLRSGSKGVPGWSQGPSQGPSRVKFDPKWVSKWLENPQKSCLQAFWKRFSKTHALSMFLNSSGLFFVCSYSCRGRLSVTCIQVKSQHSSTWLGGTVDASQIPPRCLQFPPSPGGVQDSLSPGAQTKKLISLFCDLKKWSPKVEPEVPKWSAQMIKNR